jgi:hypothetical protein
VEQYYIDSFTVVVVWSLSKEPLTAIARDSLERCHERQLQGLERKAKVEGSQLRLYKAKEGRK